MPKLLVGLALACALLASSALAQIQRHTSTVTAGTIAVTNTYQQILAEQDGRAGCTIQNNGTNVMYVYFGTTASATLAKGFKLQAGQAISCGISNTVLTDAVQITGTSTEAYTVAVQ